MELLFIQLQHLVSDRLNSLHRYIYKVSKLQQKYSIKLGDYIYGPSSEEAAATINTLTKAFCREYPINQEALSEGKSGIVIGRYPGDGYAGGNPWQLLTAVLGETFYLGAEATLKNIEKKGNYHLSMDENKEWIKLLDSNNGKKKYLIIFTEL